MIKKSILLVGCLFYALFAIAQSLDASLQNKYFLSRNRLKKWFVTANGSPGGGYPIETLQLFQSKFDYPFDRVVLKPDGTDSVINDANWLLNRDTNQAYTEASGKIVTDNPLITLGEYLSVLSTEYWLLQHYDQTNTEQFLAVKNEIYYALMAIDRLDGTAEKYFNSSITPSLGDFNGFLRRDDSDFDKLKRVNNYFGRFASAAGNIQMSDMNNIEGPAPDTGFVSLTPYITNIIPVKLRDSAIYDTTIVGGNMNIDTSIVSIYKDSAIFESNVPYHRYYRNNYRIGRNNVAHPLRGDNASDRCAGRAANEMSQDELIGIMVGLRYIQKFVDENAVAKPTNDDSLKTLVPWTREIANRLMLHLTKTATDIRALQPADFVIQQQLACIKDRKGRKVFKQVKDGIKSVSEVCPECTNKDIFSQYTGQPGEGSVYNPILFDSGNYVLTNPAAGNRHVDRGPYAFAYGGGLERLGEKLASSSGNAKDYPGVFLRLDFEEQCARYFTDFGLPGTFATLTPLLMVYSGGESLFNDNKAKWDNMINELTIRCVGSNLLGIDGISTCLTGSLFRPEEEWWWRIIWDKIGDSTTVLNKLWLKYLTESGSANVMAAKIAACNGDWDAGNFANFAEKCGFPMMSLQYDVLNNKYPFKSKSYYQDLLNTMDCLGSKGTQWPFDRDVLGGFAMLPSKQNENYYNDGSFNSEVGFMLYYNLYRIAEIQHWGNAINDYNDNSCPCYIEAFNANLKFPYSAIEPGRKVATGHNPNGSTYDSVSYSYKDVKIQTKSLVKTKDANPTHALSNIRNHEYLNHYYEIGNTKKFGITRDLIICNAQLNCKSGSEVFIDTGRNQNSPNEIVIRKDGELVLNSNSILRVNNYSRVVVEMGGKIIYNQGARIILDGPNAVLHIKGGLVLGANATFQIEGGPAGKGYVIWENNWVSNPYQYVNTATVPTGGTLLSSYGASAALIANNSNTVIFTNPSGPYNGSGNLALECRGNLGLMTGWGLGKLEIKNCRVNLGPESRIVSESDNTVISNTDIFGHYANNPTPKYDYKRTSMGVHILGRKNSVSRVKVWNCYMGMKIFNVGTYEPLKLYDVKFENCLKSIVNEGGRILYTKGTINGTSGIQRFSAIEGIGTQGKSELDSVFMEVPNYQWMNGVSYTFKTGEYATCLKSHGTGQYFLLNSQLTQADKAIELRESFARPVCTKFNENRWAVDMMQNATFNVVNKTYNSFDLPGGTITNIDKYGMVKGRQNNYLLLNEAANSFHGINGYESFIDVVLHPQNLIEPSSSTYNWSTYNSYALPARASEWKMYNGNEQDIWPEGATTPNVSLYKLISNSPATLDLATRATISGSTFTTDKGNTCPVYASNHGWKPEQTQAQNWTNGNAGFNLGSAKMPEEIYTMIHVLKENNGLPEVLGQMKIMLDSTVDDSFAPALHEIYVATHGMYRNVFSDSTIPDSARPQREEDIYDLMLDLQNTLLTRSLDNDDPYRWFKFELDRDLALIHRSFNHRNDGITHLNNVIPTYADPNEQSALLAWKCILEREQLYLDTLVPYDSVFIYGCVPNYYFDDSSHNFTLFGYNPELWGENDTTEEDTSSPSTMARHIDKQPKGQQSMQQADTKVNEHIKTADSKGSNSLMLYPNPADNSYTILCSEAIGKVQVTDNTGRLISTYDAKGKNTLLIDASAYSKGLYFVDAYTKDKRHVKRLIINH